MSAYITTTGYGIVDGTFTHASLWLVYSLWRANHGAQADRCSLKHRPARLVAA